MKEYHITSNLHEFARLKQDFPKYELKIDTELCMYDYFISWVESGKKTTIIRYARDKIRIPYGMILPLIETKKDDKEYKKQAGHITIDKLVVKSISELTDDDAIKDGFNNKDELLRTLEQIYGEILPFEHVSIYYILY